MYHYTLEYDNPATLKFVLTVITEAFRAAADNYYDMAAADTTSPEDAITAHELATLCTIYRTTFESTLADLPRSTD